MDQEKIIQKVRKLLALSASPNEAEAASAAIKVQSLLAEYNLSEEDVTESAPGHIIVETDVTVTESWRRILGNATGKLYFCQYYFQRKRYLRPTWKCGYEDKDHHMFVGKPHNVVVAKEMYLYLTRACVRLATEARKAYPDKKKQWTYYNSFISGCTVTLVDRMFERYQRTYESPMLTSAGTTLPALAPLYNQEQAQLDEFMNRQVPGTKTKSLAIPTRMAEAYADGLLAGESIGLDKQVEKHSQDLLE